MFGEKRGEFIGFLLSNGKFSYSAGATSLLFSSREIAVARKTLILANAFPVQRDSDILQKESDKSTLEFRGIRSEFQIKELLKEASKGSEEFKKSFLRGVFLGCGILSAPPYYHLEMNIEKEFEKKFVAKMLLKFGIKYLIKDDKIYIKGRENIKKFMYTIGSLSVFLLLEDDEIEKALSNEINRKANFEYANLRRQSNAALKQVKILKELRKKGKLDKLRDDLKEVALLRLRHPYASFTELSRFSLSHLSKQAVYYRLKRILKNYE